MIKRNDKTRAAIELVFGVFLDFDGLQGSVVDALATVARNTLNEHLAALTLEEDLFDGEPGTVSPEVSDALWDNWVAYAEKGYSRLLRAAYRFIFCEHSATYSEIASELGVSFELIEKDIVPGLQSAGLVCEDILNNFDSVENPTVQCYQTYDDNSAQEARKIAILKGI